MFLHAIAIVALNYGPILALKYCRKILFPTDVMLLQRKLRERGEGG